jgi:hypothetical protein
MDLHIEHIENILPIIAGDTGAAHQQVDIVDPWGNMQRTWSGNKPAHGPGGFEFNAGAGNPYVIKVAGESWQFEHKTGLTFLTWEGEPGPGPGPEPPEPEPEPEPPPEPEPGPEPGPTPQDIEVKLGHIYSARLQGDIIYWQEGMAEDAVWWFVGQYIPGADLWLPFSEPATVELLAAWLGEIQLRVERLAGCVHSVLDS